MKKDYMKKLLFALILLPCVAHAGTITTSFNPLGTITFSSSTKIANIVSFDASASTATAGGDGNTSFPITIGSCSNRFLAVGCIWGSPGNTPNISTVGGNAMTLSTSSMAGGANTIIYTYVNPPTGSQQVVIHFLNDSQSPCAAASFCNVDQSSPIEFSTATFNYLTETISSSTLTTATYGDVLFDAVMGTNPNAITTTQVNQTSIFAYIFSGNDFGVSYMPTTTAGSYDMGWTNIGGNPHTTTAIAIKAAP